MYTHTHTHISTLETIGIDEHKSLVFSSGNARLIFQYLLDLLAIDKRERERVRIFVSPMNELLMKDRFILAH